MTTLDEAKKIVEEIAGNYGGLRQEMMDKIGEFNEGYRREIDDNWLRLENTASYPIKALAENIHGSGARFVFELLQNAEDNKFTKADRLEAPPFISFEIHPKRIVVECNEDGFTQPDLKAICSVGETTKTAQHGYIGAKGIGFKSVFIAASRVHIQSGNYSFEFRHKKTDPGLGMVRPIWVAPTDDIPNPLTRTTLYLHDQGEEEDIEHLKAMISRQFDDLHETCLLFLDKLQHIRVAFYDDAGNLERLKQFRKRQIDEHRVSLETTITVSGEETAKSQIYHITKQHATGLAASDNRKPWRNEEEQGMSTTAEVILAFPLTSNCEPQLSGQKQELFAFLPLRPSDYKFHIHSDFDTDANRQDIITTSQRNRDIRDWIVKAFYQAVLQFCEHPTLCYQWPLFLPSRDNSYDSFWLELNAGIQSLIKKNPVLKSRHKNSLRFIADLSISAVNAQDEKGDPLFDDPIKDPFLSPKYSKTARGALIKYGLGLPDHGLFISLLKADLNNISSRMRGGLMSEEWHSRTARVLSKLAKNTCACCKEIKSLKIVPLRDGSWTSCEEGPVYFPATGKFKIPSVLDFRVLDSTPMRNLDRQALFAVLGVSEATTAQIRRAILLFFASRKELQPIHAVEFLTYLYLTHQTGLDTREDYRWVWIYTKGDMVHHPQNRGMVVYLPGTDNPYGPESILLGPGAAPVFDVTVLADYYTDDGPAQPSLFHPSWKTWLVDFMGIHERLSLLSLGGDALSESFLSVFRRNPKKFLGLFEHLWSYEGMKLLKYPALVTTIKYLPAKLLCRVNFSPKLMDTWLPFPRLQELVQRYMEYPDQFPFLEIESGDSDLGFGIKWNFLTEHFSVRKDNGIEFLLEILTCIQRSCPNPSVCQSQKVLDLYVAIDAKLAVAQDHAGIRSRIRDYFNKSGILALDTKPPSWTGSKVCIKGSKLCLWAAPADMKSACALKSAYTRISLNETDMTSIETLFHCTLDIRNATVNDLVSELNYLRNKSCEDTDRIIGLYKYLHYGISEPKLAGMNSSWIRLAFQRSPIIFVKQKGGPGWYRTSDCVWSSPTPCRDKVTLDESYEELKDFFINEVGVKSLSLQRVYDELKQSFNDSPERVKRTIQSLNELLKTEPTYLDPEPIRKAKVFPIRYPNGTVSIGSIDDGFAIGDRERLKTAFENKICLLDFNLEDTRRLKPFFDWVKVQDRYLSSCVEEHTSISVDTEFPILSGKRFLKGKAYHITRVAATFNSPRFNHSPHECYETLRTMDVREVGEISSVLKISQSRQFQNPQLFQSKVTTASAHITETGGKLTIYVPRESKARDVCFGSVLPRKLAAWLMRHPKTNAPGSVEADAIYALASIFASDRSALDEILDDQGIIQIPFDNNDEDEDNAAAELDGNRLLGSPQSSTQEFTPTNSPEADTVADITANIDLGEPGIETVNQSSHVSQQSPQADETSESALQENGRYGSILQKAVEAARRANFPHPGAFDMQGIRDALSNENLDTCQSFDGLDVIDKTWSSSQQERDRRVGAAGELYVFELLSKLELPNWGRQNWQSTIRKYAAVHPEYTDLSHWSNRGPADLVYVDSLSQLTNTLIEAGILTADEWLGKKPTYYFEVKTTTGPCKTPFYVCKDQYRNMERIHYNEDRSEVYMIFRIYSLLDSDRIGYRVYMDPKKLRDEGKLVFMEGTWSVRPGSVG